MENNTHFDVIIIGGSYAGLSAAMTLGRSLRRVLIIDSGKPCNRQTPHTHNFITHDGKTPNAVREEAKAQVLRYTNVSFQTDFATSAVKTISGFELTTESGKHYTAKKLILATGVSDQMPALKGFAECWGISMLHCPYCHGYEVKNESLGVLANGDMGFEFSKLISNWTKDLTLFTNGASTLTEEQTGILKKHGIKIIEKEIEELDHTNGKINHLVFKDRSTIKITAVFSRVDFKQASEIPAQLGCAFTEQGYIAIDEFQKTSVPGVYAAGDNTMMFRAVSISIGAGTKAGAILNKEMIDESFAVG